MVNEEITVEISVAQMDKYLKKTVPQLRKLAQKHFNAFIRSRDAGRYCISCDSHNITQAGHYYSAGHYPALAFDPDNVHGQCVRCNMYLSGNLINYRKYLRSRIKEPRLLALDDKAAQAKRNAYKPDKFTLIAIILKYKDKNK